MEAHLGHMVVDNTREMMPRTEPERLAASYTTQVINRNHRPKLPAAYLHPLMPRCGRVTSPSLNGRTRDRHQGVDHVTQGVGLSFLGPMGGR